MCYVTCIYHKFLVKLVLFFLFCSICLPYLVETFVFLIF
uniref:Uncharacterized protein n=1 Tax=Arundo donax TaxID=35708 RepID=A0A0A8Z9M0_ARUDO